MSPIRVRRGVEDRFWQQWSEGVGIEAAAKVVGVSESTARRWVCERGGVKPVAQRSGRDLTFEDRIAIQAGFAAGWSNAAIAREIGCHRSTVGRELARHARASDVGRSARRRGYKAVSAQTQAEQARRRPKPRKLDVNPVLHEYVQDRLKQDWSPEQISNRLAREHGKDPRMTISHEAIYQALYVHGAGGLKRELKATLRTGRKVRKAKRSQEQRGRRNASPSIVERPDEALGRAVPGHWEGDLITGAKNRTAVGTLVDRCSRYVSLLYLPDGHTAEQVRDEMINGIGRMPEAIRRTVTWDQGVEMIRHSEITAATGVQVYFCDPHSPWQRPTNENTNGLLRQYLPKSSDLSKYTREDLDHIEELLNTRPRKTLGWLTPTEYLAQVLEEDSTVARTP